MLDQIISALQARNDLSDWSVRHLEQRGVQLYAVPTAVEARRLVVAERYAVEVFRHTSKNGKSMMGSGNATLLPGDDIDQALDAAALMAGLVFNQPYTIPGPAPLPDVLLVDPALDTDAEAALNGLLERLRNAATTHPHVTLTAAEFAAETTTTRLRNSRGIDAQQTTTLLQLEWVLVCREGERESEAFVEMTRRRVADMDIEGEMARRAQYALDALRVTAPPLHRGAVVMQGSTLATFLTSNALQVLTSASAKFSKFTTVELEAPIFRGAAVGEPFTAYANRQLPFGNNSNRFDPDGLPAQRVPIIRDNYLAAFTANQRYADYLNIEPTGAFGDLELPAGKTSAAVLTGEPHIEVASFSWFNPDPITGDFSSEIRLGYVVKNGERIPFRGGALVGNVLAALGNAQWSQETGFFGDYHGPTTVRFAGLTVTGEDVDAHTT